ncbi:MAG: efflux RND transporter periplasmic adaptor subunit [Candidatus Wallbacteria bacterium]|nr:efflux RND transporter periplasmic adaptor subunit [Candidatus Wallbacteria bacterium]
MNKKTVFLLLVFSGVLISSAAEKVLGQKAQKMLLTNKLPVSSSVEPVRSAEIAPKIGGKLDKILVSEGQKVKLGDPLFLLDTTERNLQVTQAGAALEMASARKNALVQAEATYKNVRSEYQRVKTLYDVKAATKQNLEKAETALSVAEAAFQGARKMLAEEDSARSYKTLMDIQLADTRICAPFDGIVSGKLKEEGEILSSGKAVLILEQISPVKVRFGLPESFLPKIKVGQVAEMRTPAYPEQEFEFVITSINPKVNSRTGEFTLEGQTENRNEALTGGMFLAGTLILETKEAVVVPLSSIFKKVGIADSFIFKIKDGKAIEQKVKTGTVEGKWIEIAEGIESGDWIVTEGKNKLIHGMDCEIAEEK